MSNIRPNILEVNASEPFEEAIEAISDIAPNPAPPIIVRYFQIMPPPPQYTAMLAAFAEDIDDEEDDDDSVANTTETTILYQGPQLQISLILLAGTELGGSDHLH